MQVCRFSGCSLSLAGYPSPSVYPVLPPMPMQYYGEVPLAPIVMKEQSNADKPKVQQQKFLRTAGADIWEDPTLAEWSASMTLATLFFLTPRRLPHFCWKPWQRSHRRWAQACFHAVQVPRQGSRRAGQAQHEIQGLWLRFLPRPAGLPEGDKRDARCVLLQARLFLFI